MNSEYSNQEIDDILYQADIFCSNPLINHNHLNNEDSQFNVDPKNIQLIANLLDVYFKQIIKIKENYQQHNTNIMLNKKSSFDFEKCLTQLSELKKLIIANI